MVLQTLFAVASSLVPAVAFASHHSTVTIHSAGRTFTAEVIEPKGGRRLDTRYPGAVIIATESTKDRAYVVSGRLSEIGITVMMYTQEDFATYQFQLFDAKSAIDTLRRRIDVRPEEVGVIAFEEATDVVPELSRDSSLGLGFAIAASVGKPIKELSARYAKTRVATLLVQGMSNAVTMTSGQVPLTTVTMSDVKPSDGAVITTPVEAQKMTANVTLWPVPREQLETIGDAHSPLGARVVGWIKEQVHAAPIAVQQPTVTVHAN